MTSRTERTNLRTCLSHYDLGRTPDAPLVALASRTDSLYHYIIVREDLAHGVCVAMVTHAADESSAISGSAVFSPGTRVVVLAVADEESLHGISTRLTAHQVPHITFVETEGKYAGQQMAIGVAILPRDRVGPYLKHLKTLK